MSADEVWVPAACTLPTVEQPLRVREFDELFTEGMVAVDRVGPTRLRLAFAGGAATATRARDLAERESQCCSFFTFEVTADAHGTTLDVGVPAAQVAVLDALAMRATRAAA